MAAFENPFRPGAGHPPPHLAGREAERDEFRRLLGQHTILENLVLTGLRGIGKTVLLDLFKQDAIQHGWRWVGADLSESASASEERVAVRLCADLSLITGDVVVRKKVSRGIGFVAHGTRSEQLLDYDLLAGIYRRTPGLAVDKLKAVLETTWAELSTVDGAPRGVIFGYDEAQNLSDRSGAGEFPLSLLLDAFQGVQRKGLPLMLALAGLPTLFPNLVEARTFSERMFRVLFLGRLSHEESVHAVQKPIADERCPVRLSRQSVDAICEASRGYPYFIQFICREVYDAHLQQTERGRDVALSLAPIVQKLDADFFAGRWADATDRQRELLWVVAQLERCDEEFTVRQIVEKSRAGRSKPFSASHVTQMLAAMSGKGLVFKNRHGRYSFAVPLLGRFIRRQATAAGSPV